MKQSSSFTSIAAAVAVCCSYAVNAFQPQLAPGNLSGGRSKTSLHADTIRRPSGKGFAKQDLSQPQRSSDPMDWKVHEVKDELLDLLPRMTGTAEEFRQVESYVNALEEKFLAPQTLDFLNLAMAGEWQFLFTTNQLGRPSPILRLTELIQKIDVNGLKGDVTNQASWSLLGDSGSFDVYGSFATKLPYDINQGARMTLGDEDDHDLSITLGKGSGIPSDTEGLVGLIHRAMPTEMFDASDLALDTTYLDTDIRIVRFTGKRHEGVRNIFMRKGAFDLDPDL
mmetsp:Transcript_8156/g.9508  ORF Transcript_8156/g.9508 Transcript_8156/m.9508 type:complete len:282 (+) Transcript_8156:90-935(+)